MAEPTLDELLSDEIMEQVARSDGLSLGDVRAQLAALAQRLGRGDDRRAVCRALEA
jgi:hypothetical protein